jgi:hypothetical protein
MERAVGTLKNKFHILDNKPFHKYNTQVKLVLAFSMLHNWIIGFGIHEVVLDEEGFTGTQQDPPDDNGS